MPKAPRAPTQKEIDAHMATHLPHEPWCEICMKGRGRNSPHRRKTEARRREDEPGREVSKRDDSEESDTECEGVESEEELHTGPVPRVSMD